MNIIQTWKTAQLEPYYQANVDNIRRLNPEWNYVFFTDEDIILFMKNEMPEYYNTFVHLTHKIQQIDFFRYLVIYFYGGVYLDLDIEITMSLNNIYYEYTDQCVFPVELQHITDSIITSQGYTNLIGNYAFYSPPRHPFIKRIIDNIVCQRISPENISIAQKENNDPPSQVYVYCTTGPLLVTQTLIDHGIHSIMLLEPFPYRSNCFGEYGYHHCYGSWKASNKHNLLM